MPDFTRTGAHLMNLEFHGLVDSACDRGAPIDRFLRYLLYLEERYMATQNPIHAIDAMGACLQRQNEGIAVDRRAEEFPLVDELYDRLYDRRIFDGIRTRSTRINLLFPRFCLMYLGVFTGNFYNLSHNLDPKEWSRVARTSPRELGAFALNPTLNEAEAASRVLSAAGFVRHGKNAFKDYHSEVISLNFEQEFRYCQYALLSKNQSYEQIAEKFELDLRTVQRRVREGRRLIADLGRFLDGKNDKTSP